MALGTPLARILSMIRAEARLTQNVSAGQNADDTLRQKVARTQETLWQETDWPFLYVNRDFYTQEGQNLYTFPVDMDYSRIDRIETSYASIWRRVIPGITDADYSLVNPALGATQDPQLKWELRENFMLELWPPPASNGNWMRIWGIKNCAPLVQDTDLATLDDNLIVLHVAAELLAAAKSADARGAAQMAKDKLMTLRGNSNKRKRHNMLGKAGWPGGAGNCGEEDAFRMRVTYAKASGG